MVTAIPMILFNWQFGNPNYNVHYIPCESDQTRDDREVPGRRSDHHPLVARRLSALIHLAHAEEH
jgi:hypothetical protein